ncbi:MAG TPA: glycine betaine ABC transporter substrate-binding protein [Burkholderiales bacterium]|nr:glycine betaine ABC transporter substrate-binding protein [Burkholderiales bacterium]
MQQHPSRVTSHESRLCWTLALLLLAPALVWAQGTLSVGSKRFTESYVLGEIITQTAAKAGTAQVVHQQGLGNTAILHAALKAGAIHVYPEYTGTIAFELLGLKRVPPLAELNRMLANDGLAVGVPLGFANSYALAMVATQAASLGIGRLSDLARHPQLRLGLSQEFLNRKDGWEALKAAYAMPFSPRGLDHGLAYEALAAGQLDVIDVYSTDAKIERYKLTVLQDDRSFFPAYDAVLFYRLDVPARFGATWEAVKGLEGRITARNMIAMNAAAELDRTPFAQVAAGFVVPQDPGSPLAGKPRQPSFLEVLLAPDLGRLTAEHLLLVFVSLALSVAVGMPLGIWAERAPRARGAILGAAGILQTVPALALLAFLIAAFDRIGTLPAIAALFLYGLLPIVRNTQSGLADIAPALREASLVLGLPPAARLRLIELPLASRSILAGIKTSAVINVGTATIAAFIGAGGYGERIVAGLAVNDHAMLLAGAIPAAAMALILQWGFDGLDRWLVPAGLQEK